MVNESKLVVPHLDFMLCSDGLEISQMIKDLHA